MNVSNDTNTVGTGQRKPLYPPGEVQYPKFVPTDMFVASCDGYRNSVLLPPNTGRAKDDKRSNEKYVYDIGLIAGLELGLVYLADDEAYRKATGRVRTVPAFTDKHLMQLWASQGK